MSEPSAASNSCPQCGAVLPSAATAGLCPRCLMAEAMAATQADAELAALGQALSPEELAPHFPQLEILECLGRGGMGVVYKARQKSLNRLVALKLLAPERVADAKFAQRFTHEAQALAALNHPSIVTIHDFGQAGGFYFLLMEFVDGVNLRQAMRAGRFTPEQALAVVPPVCEALQYAHEHGIVHRDIKPENLLLDKDGRVKIADFGIAKMLGADGARLWLESQPRHLGQSEPAAAGPADTAALHTEPTLASTAGTPQYMAPEQKAHGRTDHRADIYSLGVVLYELLTGELPADKLQPPSRKVQIDVRLDEIVLRALETKPELRYQTAEELRTQVETFNSSPPSSRGNEAPSDRKDQSLLTSVATGARFLKAGTSTLTTPAQLATASGQFFCYRTRGQLVLDDQQLTHSCAGVNTVIPLAAVRDLSIGKFPRVMAPAGIDLISFIYEEAGRRKQFLLFPMVGWFGFPSTANAHVAEWFAAIREAVTAATGRTPGTTPADKLNLPSSSRSALALMLAGPLVALLVLTGCLVTVALMRSDSGVPSTLWLVVALPVIFALVAAGLPLLLRPRTGNGSSFALALLLLLLGIAIPIAGISMHNSSVRAAADDHLKYIKSLQRGVMSLSTQIGEANAVAGRAASRAGNSAEREETRAQAREEQRMYDQRSKNLRAELDRAHAALAVAGNQQVDAHPWRVVSILGTGLLLALAGGGMLLRVRRRNGADTNLPQTMSPVRPSFKYAGLLMILMPVLLLGILAVKFFSEANSLSGVTHFDIAPVGVSNNVVIVDVTTEVGRGHVELRAVLDGPQLSAATEAALADTFFPPFAGTFVKPTPHAGNHPWRILSTGRQTWRLGFVLPDDALAQEAMQTLHPVGPLPAKADRTFAGTLFEVRQTNGQAFRASLQVALPFTSADTDWVSVFGQSRHDGSAVTLSWEVLAAGNGLAQFSRAGSPILVVQPNPQTKLHGVTARLELTKAGTNRVLLVRHIGGDAIREELPGDFRELADELLRTANFSAKGTSGTLFELCRIQGKPFTVQVHVTDSPGTYQLKVGAVVGLGVLVMMALVAGILFALRRKQRGDSPVGKGGSTVKVVLLLASVPVLVLAVGLILYMAARAQQATNAEQEAMAAARAEVEARAGLPRTTTPAIQPALAAWQQGDQGGAVSNFLAADWTAGPIVASESMLSLTESWFLSQMRPVPGVGVTGDVEVRSEQMMNELRTVKELVAAVSQAGMYAAATNNAALAGKHFESLQRFGLALDQPDHLNILRLEGRTIKLKADAELQQILPNAPRASSQPRVISVDARPDGSSTATYAVPTKFAVGVSWFRILAVLFLFAILGGGVLVLVLLLRKRGSGAAKVVAVLVGVALLLFLLVVGLIFVYWNIRREQGGRAAKVERHAAMTESQRIERQLATGDFPTGAHIGRNGQSVMVSHGTTDLHHVFYYAGDFGSSSYGTHNAKTRSWVDEGSVKLKNKRSFGYRREALYPDELTVNGARYDLQKGRVFVLNDDGTMEQLKLFPPLAVARDPEILAKLLGGAPASIREQIEFKVLRVENPPGTRNILLHFERDTNYGLAFEVSQNVMPSPDGKVPGAGHRDWQQQTWVGLNAGRVLNWTLPAEFSETEARDAARDMQNKWKGVRPLPDGAVPEFANVKHRDGWTYFLIARVLREPGAPRPRPPGNAVLLGESVGTVPAGAVVKVEWQRAVKDVSLSPIGAPLTFKVAEGRPGKLRFRWYTYDSKNPLMAGRWFLDIHDEYTGNIFHRVEDDFGRPVKFVSPIFKPEQVQTFTLGPQKAVAAVHKIIHAEPVTPPGQPITDWWDVIMTVMPGPIGKFSPVPEFQLPSAVR